MKKNLICLFAATGLLLVTACTSSEKTKPEVTNTEAPAQSDANEVKQTTVSGTVTETQPGKDGYTARILTTDGKEFYATISRANLTAPESYRSVNPGDSVTVSGDLWQMDGRDYITGRELLQKVK